METTTRTITAPLPVIHDMARIGALYASDEPHKAALQCMTITATTDGLEAHATDSYALAIWTATNVTSTLAEPIRIMAHDFYKHTTAAVKAIGKKQAADVAATLAVDSTTWTLTAGPLTTTGPTTHVETPNIEPFRATIASTETATFEPYTMGAFQLARLAKTNPTGPEAGIQHRHYSSPAKPLVWATNYTTAGHTVTVEVLAMPMRNK